MLGTIFHQDAIGSPTVHLQETLVAQSGTVQRTTY